MNRDALAVDEAAYSVAGIRVLQRHGLNVIDEFSRRLRLPKPAIHTFGLNATKIGYLVMKQKRKPPLATSKAHEKAGSTCVGPELAYKIFRSNIVRSYPKSSGVDLLCTVKELSLCGIAVDRLRCQLKATHCHRAVTQNIKRDRSRWLSYGCDKNFAYIRPNGGDSAYSTTLEELEGERPGPSDQDHRAMTT